MAAVYDRCVHMHATCTYACHVYICMPQVSFMEQVFGFSARETVVIMGAHTMFPARDSNPGLGVTALLSALCSPLKRPEFESR